MSTHVLLTRGLVEGTRFYVDLVFTGDPRTGVLRVQSNSAPVFPHEPKNRLHNLMTLTLHAVDPLLLDANLQGSRWRFYATSYAEGAKETFVSAEEAFRAAARSVWGVQFSNQEVLC